MSLSKAGFCSRTREASPLEHRKWVEVFKACDADNKGYLSREDFKIAIVMLFGYKPSKIEADSLMSSINPNTSDRGYLTLEDFKKAFKQVAPRLPGRTVLEVFRSTFVRHDENMVDAAAERHPAKRQACENITVHPHPYHTPDLAPHGFWLFLNITMTMKHKCFELIQDVEAATLAN
ncbi:EF-hand calcium-binding domain-containing protein 11 isoform X2 [Cavia porcellus]|uniref:EF-hand calcium-binding domain-containing protein 11 isoform X2 n=1 Tax=Cavia porcellus TaxID=10141 RepID=UPI002FE2C087